MALNGAAEDGRTAELCMESIMIKKEENSVEEATNVFIKSEDSCTPESSMQLSVKEEEDSNQESETVFIKTEDGCIPESCSQSVLQKERDAIQEASAVYVKTEDGCMVEPSEQPIISEAAAVSIKTEDSSISMSCVQSVVKMEDSSSQEAGALELERESIPSYSNEESYPKDFPSNFGQHFLLEDTTPEALLRKLPEIIHEKIVVKLQPGFVDGRISTSSINLPRSELTGTRMTDRSKGITHGSTKDISCKYLANANQSFSVSNATATSQLSSSDTEKPFSCPVCSSQFRNRSNFKRHVESHSDDKPFQCKHCPARFKSRSGHRLHIIAHSNTKPFACELCPAGFISSTHLKRHLLKHTNEKAYPCELCSARFKTRDHLKQHLAIHSGEKPYPCERCSARFRTKGSLKQHLARNSGCS